eukprot:8176872-Lingulodinium_polyedra.AAC.1
MPKVYVVANTPASSTGLDGTGMLLDHDTGTPGGRTWAGGSPRVAAAPAPSLATIGAGSAQ